MDHPAADQTTHFVGGQIVPRQNCQDTFAGAGGRQIDFFDRGMGMGRAQKGRIGLTGAIDVVGILPLAGNKAEVFLAPDRRSDSSCRHGLCPPEGGAGSADARLIKVKMKKEKQSDQRQTNPC